MKRKMIYTMAAASFAIVLAGCGGGFSSPTSESGGETKTGGQSGSSDPATGAETVYKVAFNQTETHPQYVATTHLGERIAESTGGKCTLQVFPNETLGTQKDTIELVQAGSIDFALIAGSLLENFNDDFVVFNLPYTFDSQEHQKSVINDPEIVGDLYSSIEDQNLTVLAGLHGGVRSIYNAKKPINTPADLDGMKIRVIESDTNLRMLELMGGSGTPMGQGEVYTAIQSGVLDGAENNPSIYSNLKHAEIAPYYSYTRHLMFPDYLITSPTLLQTMDPDCVEALEAELPAMIDEEAELWVAEVDAATKAAEEAGAKFNEVDIAAFQDAIKPLVDEKITSDTAKQIYEKARAAASK